MIKPKESDYGLVNGSNYNKIDLYKYTRELQKYCEYLEKVKELPIADVVGRNEQYHCELYDFGRKDKPCDKQCDGCKAMNLD